MLLSACGALTSRETDSGSEEAARYARTGDLRAEVDALARPLVEEGETPGIVVGVLLPDGATRFFGYGVADLDSGRRPDADTIFAVGSLSKLALGEIAAALVADGVLSWNETLGELLPPATRLSADARKITLQELATHTSGLPRQPMAFETFRYFVEYLFTGKDFYRHLDRDYLLDYLAEFEAPPGKEAEYSNIGYALLGYVVELRAGRSLGSLLEQEIVRPLGLKSTGYAPQELPGYADRARGHAGDQPKFIPRGTPLADWRFSDFMRAAGGLHSSARDLLTFAAAHLARKAPSTAWAVDDVDGQAIAYRAGFVGGFSSYLGLDTERRTAVVVLQNSLNWTDKVGRRLLVRMHRADILAV